MRSSVSDSLPTHQTLTEELWKMKFGLMLQARCDLMGVQAVIHNILWNPLDPR